MSSVPPNMPPGGGAPPPYPPYDPKTQWRAYREQQKAAWRAQRDAWKAQRFAYKAGYGGVYAPRVPSIVGPVILITVGVVALLIVSGHIAASQFWSWYGHWWPLLLILAGLGLLAEWALDLRRKHRFDAAAALWDSLFCWRSWGLGPLDGITWVPGSTIGITKTGTSSILECPSTITISRRRAHRFPQTPRSISRFRVET